MTILGRSKLEAFVRKHRDGRTWIQSWLAEVERAKWRTPQEIKDRYNSASFLPDNTVIFNIKGNHYRLEIQIAYKTKMIVVKWIGTHAEYTKRHR